MSAVIPPEGAQRLARRPPGFLGPGLPDLGGQLQEPIDDRAGHDSLDGSQRSRVIASEAIG